MNMRRLSFAFFLLTLPAWAQHTYYISQSAAGASDSNTSTQAQSKTTPWKHLPCMANATSNAASYSAIPGDVFVLMGGDTWANASFPCTWSASGSSGSIITVDRDVTWFSGGSWNRPIFDAGGAVMGGTECSGQNAYVVFSSANYVTFNWVELTGYYWNANAGGSCGNNTGSLVDASNSDHITWSNGYVHNWSHGGSAGDSDHFWNIVNTGTKCPNCLFTSGVVDNTDSLVCGSSGTRCGGGWQWSTTNSVFTWMVNELKPKSQGTFCGNNLSGVGHGFDSTHENIIEPVGGSTGPNLYYFCNNYIHDTVSGELQFGNTGDVYYIWNNVDVGGTNGRSWSFPQQPGAGMSLSFWNNTTVSSAGTGGILTCNTCNPATWVNVDIENNHFITTSTAANGPILGLIQCSPNDCGTNPFPASGTRVISSTDNIVITPTNATSQGYTNSETYVYSPPNANCSGIPTNCPIGIGANLTSSWPAGFATSDTTYAVTEQTINGVIQAVASGRTLNARPGSGVWDAGAYEFASSSPSQPTNGVRHFSILQ